MANLRSWKKKLGNAVYYPFDEKDFEADHPDCPKCGNTMNFYGHDENGDFSYGEGYWECGSCGFKISEDEIIYPDDY